MKIKKRFFAFLLMFAMAVTLMPITAFADDEVSTKTTTGTVDVSTWNELCEKYASVEAGTVTINIESGTIVNVTENLTMKKYEECTDFVITGGGTIQAGESCTQIITPQVNYAYVLTLTLKNITFDGQHDKYPEKTAVRGFYGTDLENFKLNIEDGCVMQNFYVSSAGGSAIHFATWAYSGFEFHNSFTMTGGTICNNHGTAIYIAGAGGTYDVTPVKFTGGIIRDNEGLNLSTCPAGGIGITGSSLNVKEGVHVTIENMEFSGNSTPYGKGRDLSLSNSGGLVTLEKFADNTFSSNSAVSEEDKYLDILWSVSSTRSSINAMLDQDMYLSVGGNSEDAVFVTGADDYKLSTKDAEKFHIDPSIEQHYLRLDEENNALKFSTIASGYGRRTYTVTGLGTKLAPTISVKDVTDSDNPTNVASTTSTTIAVAPGHEYEVTLKAKGFKDSVDTFTVSDASDTTQSIEMKPDFSDCVIANYTMLKELCNAEEDEEGAVTITVPEEVEKITVTSQIMISGDVTINGGKFVRDEDNRLSMFWLSDGTFSFKDVTFDGNNVQNAASLLYSNLYSTGTIINMSGCTFQNADCSGSIIEHNYGTLTLKDCTIKDSTVQTGVFSNSGNLTIDGCSIADISVPADNDTVCSLFNLTTQFHFLTNSDVVPNLDITNLTVADSVATNGVQLCINNTVVPEYSYQWDSSLGINSVLLKGTYASIQFDKAISEANGISVMVSAPAENTVIAKGTDDYTLTEADFEKIKYSAVPVEEDETETTYYPHLSTDNNNIFLSSVNSEDLIMYLSVKAWGTEYNGKQEYFTLKDSQEQEPAKIDTGIYQVKKNETYTCTVTGVEHFADKTATFTVSKDGQSFNVELTAEKDENGEYWVNGWEQLLGGYGSVDEEGAITITIPEDVVVTNSARIDVPGGINVTITGGGTLKESKDVQVSTGAGTGRYCGLLSFNGLNRDERVVTLENITIDANCYGEDAERSDQNIPVIATAGVLNINEGVVIKNANADAGNNSNASGVVAVGSSGTLNMNGGTIENCYLGDGSYGAVFGCSNSTVYLNGGTIKNCQGGAVVVYWSPYSGSVIYKGTKFENLSDDLNLTIAGTSSADLVLYGGTGGLGVVIPFNGRIVIASELTEDIEFSLQNQYVSISDGYVIGLPYEDYTLKASDAAHLKFPSELKRAAVLDAENNQLVARQTYDITWNVGGVTTTEAFVKDSVPVYTGNPTWEVDDDTCYVLSGWTDSDSVSYTLEEALPTVTQDETYTAQGTLTERIDFSDDVTIDAIPDCVDKGEAVTPEVTVKLGDATLILDRDYTVTYANNTGVGKGKVIITGIGLYKGSKEAEFNIVAPAGNIEDAVITLDQDSWEYTGEAITPKVTVKLGDSTLVLDKDYTVTYEDNKEVGTGKVIITGAGLYIGSKEVTFNIVKASDDDENDPGTDDGNGDGDDTVKDPGTDDGNDTVKDPGNGTGTVTGKADQAITGVNDKYSSAYNTSGMTLAAKAQGALSYVSSDTKVVKVDKNTGKVTYVGAGTATITITAAETANYKAATKKVTITVTRAAQKITTKAKATVKYKAANLKKRKETLKLVARTSGNGKLTYKITKYPKNMQKKIKVSKAGKVTIKKGAKKGTYKVQIKAAKTLQYKQKTKVIKIKIS